MSRIVREFENMKEKNRMIEGRRVLEKGGGGENRRAEFQAEAVRATESPRKQLKESVRKKIDHVSFNL